ncbi:MAG: hypothetical protein LBC17_00890 [Lactobacillaceae bacterium]|jgi:hypothetical protein|nr:hypothetical protein [Lactobacillaceae bacterium]
MFSLNVVAEQNALIEFLIEAVAGLITGMLRTFLFPLINFAYLIGV